MAEEEDDDDDDDDDDGVWLGRVAVFLIPDVSTGSTALKFKNEAYKTRRSKTLTDKYGSRSPDTCT
jgi:hypothetical protein